MEFALIDTSSSDALALRATASGFDAVRGKLPVTGNPDHSLDSVTVARQLSDLGTLITDLADEVLHRAAEQRREGGTAPAVVGFAAAVRPACEAASALGAVAHRLSVLEQAEHLGDESGAKDAREADRLVMGNALGMADKALRETANSLRSASAAISPESVRAQAARSRSTTAAFPSSPAPPPAPAAAPPGRIARGR
ncbi:hypothetical protein [Streptomyces sp. Wb2n-11]|uniref:hypothetical protein n=1 Tax=Streptomyces sp. Wb2n-11 TaxID=1030533 RepID=UPI000B24654E|nr:hypothetical protein [Streptomyces sp. Wb2n-11]